MTCVKSATGSADMTSVIGSSWIEPEYHGKVNTCPAIWWWEKELAVVPYGKMACLETFFGYVQTVLVHKCLWEFLSF